MVAFVTCCYSYVMFQNIYFLIFNPQLKHTPGVASGMLSHPICTVYLIYYVSVHIDEGLGLKKYI